MCHGWRKSNSVCMCVSERVSEKSKLCLYEGAVQCECMVYSISVLNVAWWTASDIDLCVDLCVFPALLIKFSMHTLGLGNMAKKVVTIKKF